MGGIESCFVSLPLLLIETLQSTAGGVLPPVLGLELRSRDGGCWKLAWSGSASRSPAIEVDDHLVACLLSSLCLIPSTRTFWDVLGGKGVLAWFASRLSWSTFRWACALSVFDFGFFSLLLFSYPILACWWLVEFLFRWFVNGERYSLK